MKKIYKIIIVIFILTILVGLYNLPKLMFKKTIELPEVKLRETVNKEKTFAIMIQNGEDYEEYSSNTWPDENYQFKDAKCVNDNGALVENAITFTDGKATIETNQTIYCTLYFDKSTLGKLRDSETLANKHNLSPLPNQGGMYRYQAVFAEGDSAEMTNWICFGTTDNCGTNDDLIDKYMYRIIGITKEGQMYLIKETFLKEKSGGINFSWDTYGDINPSSVNYCNNNDKCADWNTSLLFKRINGISNGEKAGTGAYSNKANTDIFIDNEVYDYLKSGDANGTNDGIGSTWYQLIANHDWMYGDMAENVASILYNGDTMYQIENGDLETKHYIGPMENITEESYKWPKDTNKVTAKIGLMYMHDVDYAYPGGNPTNETNLKNSWLHFRKDGYNTTLTYEWLITRWGLGGPNKTNIDSWAIWHASGFSGWDTGGSLASAGGVRPVFYLNSSTRIDGGGGTKNNPYIIKVEEI